MVSLGHQLCSKAFVPPDLTAVTGFPKGLACPVLDTSKTAAQALARRKAPGTRRFIDAIPNFTQFSIASHAT